MLNALPRHSHHPARAGVRTPSATCLTRGRLALRCSIRSVICGSSPVAFARTDNWGRPIPRRHTLTLIVSFFARAPLSVRRARVTARSRQPLRPVAKKETGCVCLHALSSFQRTDFTGLSWRRPDSPMKPRSTSSADRLLGNLLRLLEPSAPVNLANSAGARWRARGDLSGAGPLSWSFPGRRP